MERWGKKMDAITPRSRRIAFLLLAIPLTLLFIFGCTVQVHDRPTTPIPPEIPSRDDGSGTKTEHVFIVVMDGVRYSETFGDPRLTRPTLADRNLIKAAADYVLATAKPEGVAADLMGEVVLRGMIRAQGETKDPRYLQFVQRWIDVHKHAKTTEQQAILGKVILELPSGVRQPHMDLAIQIGDRSLASPLYFADESHASIVGLFLGRLSEVTKRPKYEEPGLRMIKSALRQPDHKRPTDIEKAYELFLLGQAAALFRDDITVMKAYILTAAQALNRMKEDGALWDDPVVSALNLCAIEASMRRGAMREFTQRRDELPACIKVMTQEELRALFPDRAMGCLEDLLTTAPHFYILI